MKTHKIWVTLDLAWDDAPKLGVDWFRHRTRNKWKGFSVYLYFFSRVASFNWVNDYPAYRKKMDYRMSAVLNPPKRGIEK